MSNKLNQTHIRMEECATKYSRGESNFVSIYGVVAAAVDLLGVGVCLWKDGIYFVFAIAPEAESVID